jgi:hypothetical protein
MKFRKKSVEVEAMQFNGDNSSMIAEFMKQITRTTYFPDENNPSGRKTIIIHTLEGDMEANIGDWIIKGIKGEFYPCKSDIFAETYELVEDE